MKSYLFFVVSIFLFPSIVYGVTIVDDIQVDTVWTIQDSPYLLNDPFIIYPGATLTINPGVAIKMRSNGVFILRGGNVIAKGAVNQPIYLTSEKDDSVFGDTNLDGNNTTPDRGEWLGIEIEPGSRADLENVFIRYAGGAQFTQPTILNDGILNISSSTLSDGIVGIHNRLGTAVLQKLDLLKHDTGIFSTGGNVSIGYSNIETASVGVINQSSNVVSATNNWWNDASGPFHHQLNPSGIGVAIDDNVDFVPWLFGRYGSSSAPQICCSSVLFLPGFMASDLYVQEGIFENQLWPPTNLFKSDIYKLMFDSGGSPVIPGIYTKDILEEVFGFNIYKSFADLMRSLVQTGVIEEWLPFPYDWRKDLSEVVNNFTLVKTFDSFENKKLIDEAVALAGRSPTGKINIVGHSNGGLVGKYLIRELVKQGNGSVVDQFILVATPQLGAPKALAGLLHGDEQKIPSAIGLLMNKSLARSLGKDMQSAHNLFPINMYFQNTTGPAISFDPSISDVFDYNFYGHPQEIFSYSDLFSFVTSPERGSTSGDPTDVPSVLKANLLTNADITISDLHQWAFPSSVKVYQLIGVGRQTTAGIRYLSKQQVVCDTQNGLYTCGQESFWDRVPLQTFDGDGTVLASSAEASGGLNSKSYFINLFNANKGLVVNREHTDILENPSVLQLMEDIISSTQNPSLPSYVTESKPTIPNAYQQISIHSPVGLDVIDSNGRVVGRDESKPAGDFVFIREEVPNSTYFEIKDQKYITVPLDANYDVRLDGEGEGVFTLSIDQYQNGSFIKKSFVDIPITPIMKAEINIDESNTVSHLRIDTDGDGTEEVTLAPKEVFDPVAYLEVLKSVLVGFDIKKTQERRYLREIGSLIEILDAHNRDRAKEKVRKYKKTLEQLLITKRERDGFDSNEIQLFIRYLERLIINL